MSPHPKNEGGRHPFRLLLLLLNGFFLLLLALQVTVLVWLLPDGRFTLPPSLIERVQDGLKDRGYTVDIKSLEVDLRGYLSADSVNIGLVDISEPLIEIESILVEINPWALLIGRVSPVDLRVLNARAYCPAVYSPSGTREPVVTDFFINAHREGHYWQLKRLHFRSAGIEVVAAGPLPMRFVRRQQSDKPKDKKSREAIHATIQEVCRYLMETTEITKQIESPLVLIQLERETSEGVSFRFDCQSDGYHDGKGIKLGTNLLQGLAHLGDDYNLHPTGPAIAQAYSLQYADIASSGFTELHVELGQGLRGMFLSLPKSVTAFAYDFQVQGLKFDGVILGAVPDGKDKLKFNASIKRGDNWFDSNGLLNLINESANINLVGRWDPKFFLKAKPFEEMGSLPDLEFAERPLFDAHLTLGNGWNFEKTEIEIDSSKARYEHLHFERLYAQATLVPGKLHLAHAEISTADYTIRGRYWQDLKTNDYRFLIRGNIQPMEIAFLVDEPWWDDLFGRFEYASGLPYANIDLRGRYKDSGKHKWMFGNALIPKSTYRGIAIDSASAWFYQIPSTLNIMSLDIQQGKQSALADLQFRYVPDGKDRLSLAFAASTDMPIKDVATLIGPEVEEYESIFESTVPPRLCAVGLAYGEDSPQRGEVFFNLNAQFSDSFVFDGITFDHGDMDILSKPKSVDIDNVNAGLAKGTLTGSAKLHTLDTGDRTLSLDLDLKNAQLLQLLTVIPQLKKVRDDSDAEDQAEGAMDAGSSEKQDSGQEAITPEQRYAGEVSISFRGQGTIGDLKSYVGQGKADLKNAHLGRLHLFGGLSRLLQGMGIGFGTLDFTKASMAYRFHNSTIYIPAGDISGNTARISANGYYNTHTDFLDFILTLYPLGGIDTPIISTVLSVLNPLTQTIEVELKGPISKPDWQTTFRPLRIITGQQQVKEPSSD